MFRFIYDSLILDILIQHFLRLEVIQLPIGFIYIVPLSQGHKFKLSPGKIQPDPPEKKNPVKIYGQVLLFRLVDFAGSFFLDPRQFKNSV